MNGRTTLKSQAISVTGKSLIEAILLLLYEAESKLGYAGSLDHSDAFQFDWLCVQMVEQPDATAKQDRRQVDIYFVKQPCLEPLLQDAGSILIAERGEYVRLCAQPCGPIELLLQFFQKCVETLIAFIETVLHTRLDHAVPV